MKVIVRTRTALLQDSCTPRQIGITTAVAELLPVTDDALGAIRAAGKISKPALEAPSSTALSA